MNSKRDPGTPVVYLTTAPCLLLAQEPAAGTRRYAAVTGSPGQATPAARL